MTTLIGHDAIAHAARTEAARIACHDSAGILALRADAELRRRVGHAPGRIARWQTLRGLVADGVCGPRTLASLDLA
jgi:hypothetical protein